MEKPPKGYKPDLAVEVLREDDGKLYSQIRDRKKIPGDYYHRLVVIDRQRGRMLDPDTVINRAQAMAELTGYPYHEDLTWPCRARKGFSDCSCPECAKRTDDRAKK